MTSFVDVMANDVWSDADITRRTEAMLRTEFSQEAETILNRKVLGSAMDTYVLTPQDQADIARYNTVALAAQAMGVSARADAALLNGALAVEDAQRRLAMPPLVNPDPPEPPIYTEEQLAQDAAERAAAQAVIDTATPEVMELVAERAAYRAASEPVDDPVDPPSDTPEGDVIPD